MLVKRTPEEIIARIEEIVDDDWLGFRREILLHSLPFEYAKRFLKEGTLASWWEERPGFAALVVDEYEWALKKVANHRAISAGCAVEHLTQLAWLMGDDALVAAMDAAEYENYGAPKVKLFAAAMGFEWPDALGLERMANGLPCEPECESGCGQE